MGAAALLIGIGIYCLLTMKNMVKLLIGIEIIAKGIALALIATGFAKEQPAACPEFGHFGNCRRCCRHRHGPGHHHQN